MTEFEFRDILQDEIQQAIGIEQICFPPHEACTPEQMEQRIRIAPEMFLVAVDKKSGKIAGFLNGLATDESAFRDEFFMDAGLYKPEGENIMLLGLDVLPQYRGKGLARELVIRYFERERAKGRKMLYLTCLEEKISMYEKMGFVNIGVSASVWGDEVWYDMSYAL